jgi:hypothetical protein
MSLRICSYRFVPAPHWRVPFLHRGRYNSKSLQHPPDAIEYDTYADASISALRRATVELLSPTCFATL